MRYGCPNHNCHLHLKREQIVRDGRYFRANDSRWIQRYRCQCCGRRFSSATFSLACGQKKRRVNSKVMELLCARVSMRRIAKLLKIHRITVQRKLLYLAEKSAVAHDEFLAALKRKPLTHIQFDDLITAEHTKMKPLSVSIAVDGDSRRILGVEVSQIAAFGHLAEKSRRKYGQRKSNHREALNRLFARISPVISPTAEIRSDEHQFYEPVVRKFLPRARHKRFKGGRSCVAGQGELKRKGFDPLFSLNHSCAMLRGNINRLIRKTWCTTKKPENLAAHLMIYVHYHNTQLIKSA